MDYTEPNTTSGYVKPLDINLSDAYINITELSTKGYCHIFKAQRYSRWFVLKTLSPSLRVDPRYIAMLQKEFDTAVKLDHPNIVRTISIDNIPDLGPAIVMEYVNGRTLKDFLRERPSKALRRKVLAQLLAAMGYYHSLGIVHRDLKLSNILITHNGDNVKIIDFGLADGDDYANLKEPAYTEGYAAPEQMEAGRTVDCRTDIYAFGVILSKVFPHNYQYSIVSRRCRHADPDQRYPDAKAVAEALRKADIFMRIGWASVIVLLVTSVFIFLFTTGVVSSNSQPAVPEQEQLDSQAGLIGPDSEGDLVFGSRSWQKAFREALLAHRSTCGSLCNILCKKVDNNEISSKNEGRSITRALYMQSMIIALDRIAPLTASEKEFSQVSDRFIRISMDMLYSMNRHVRLSPLKDVPTTDKEKRQEIDADSLMEALQLEMIHKKNRLLEIYPTVEN